MTGCYRLQKLQKLQSTCMMRILRYDVVRVERFRVPWSLPL